MKRLLVTGAGGLLGSNVVRGGQDRFETLGLWNVHPCVLPGRMTQVDLTDFPALEHVMREFRPEIVVHAGAMSMPVECEKQPERATRVNVDATRRLAMLSAEIGARFVFVSTDLVFDGEKGNYREEDPVNPLGHYARTKMQAEEATRSGAANHLIVRTTLMIGSSPRGNRSVNESMKLALDRGETLDLFHDEFRSPIGVQNLAACILELANGTEVGIVHLGGPERRSRYDWGVLIAGHFGWEVGRIRSASRRDHRLNPPRPPDVSMDITKARRLLKTRIQPIEEVLRELG